MNIKSALFLVLTVAICFSSKAQERFQKGKTTPFILGRVDKVESRQLGETRVLNIYLPQGYDTAKASYPVIYLLDGSADEDFVHVAGLVQFLNMIEAMPQSIIVGIANVDRKRDFTHPATVAEDKKLLPTSGGSEKFMSFLEKDLQPYITSHYRTTTRKTIIGQSLGGLFATEVLLKKPQLFTDYIIVSPSLWWNNESLLAQAPALLNMNSRGNTKVYISVGNEGKEMEGDVSKLVGLLHNYPGRFTLTFMPLPQETHLTILHNAVYKAFELLNKK